MAEAQHGSEGTTGAMDGGVAPIAVAAPPARVASWPKRWIPILVACLAGIVDGLSGWLPHAKGIQLLADLTIWACAFTWLSLDANERHLRVGTWIGILTLLFQPAGLLIWFIKHWRWRFYRPLAAYLLCVLAVLVCAVIGHLLGGLCHGHPLSALF
jgi:hypothetical protein